MKRKIAEGIEAKNSNQNAPKIDFISEDKLLKVNVNLFPSKDKPDFNDSYKLYVHVIDFQIADGEVLHSVLFGNKEDERIYRGIWNIAKVTINGIEMHVPFNTMKQDRSKSVLFNPNTGEGYEFTNVQAVLTMASFMYSFLNFHKYEVPNFKTYVDYTSGKIDADNFYVYLKEFVYEQDNEKNYSFKIMD